MTNQDLSRFKFDRGVPRRPNRRRYWIAGAGVVLLLTMGLMLARGGATAVETTSAGTAYPSQGLAQLNATGYVVASRRAAVASKATGRLEWLGVQEGSRVKQGDILARLENQDMRANVSLSAANLRGARAKREQAEAELKDAQAVLERARDLLVKQFIAPSAFDSAVARHDKAQAAVSAAKAEIGVAEAGLRGSQVAYEYTLIRAPFDGVVLTKQANVGDVITPFAAATDAKGAVVTMADMDTLEVEADVSESNLHTVTVQQPCEIQLDAIPGARFRGAVSRIVPTVDRAKATVLVKVRFIDRDPRILPDMSAKVAFLSQAIDPAHNQPVVALTQKALTRRNQRDVVFVVEQGRAKLTPVTRGKSIGDLVEIRSGLKAGAIVVLNPAPDLQDGARIKPPAK
jgi:HlyD family secretion protein